MAEVASTVFGVISLSIQLFDKLSKYTNSAKDARTKAEQITRELDALVNHLENLETVISRLDPTTSTALTKTSVHECTRAIETIRVRLGDATSVISSGRFWTRSRIVIKRLAYPFKESDIKYWKEVLTSIQQSLQIALLTLQTDQQQQYFASLQAQLGQLSLNTNAGIQMILDQQRRAQATASPYITNQGQSSGIEIYSHQRHQGSSKPITNPSEINATITKDTLQNSSQASVCAEGDIFLLYERHQRSVQCVLQDYDHVSAQSTPIGARAPGAFETVGRSDLADTLLPVSVVRLEEDITTGINTWYLESKPP